MEPSGGDDDAEGGRDPVAPDGASTTDVEAHADEAPVGGPRGSGAIADPATRAALVRTVAVAVAWFAVSVLLVLIGLSRAIDVRARQNDLESGGDRKKGIVITADQPVPKARLVTFAYDGHDEERVRSELIAFGPYERGQAIVVFVDPDDPTEATIDGEHPWTGREWATTVLLLTVGLVALPFGIRRVLRATRSWTVLRDHPWTVWTMQAVYPSRRRLAVTPMSGTDEHLLRIERRPARKLARMERKSEVYLAGSGRWFVVSPPTGRRTVVLGRMDVPYDRLRLVHPGAAPDRFDHQAPPEQLY